jgi:hypothetical protein
LQDVWQEAARRREHASVTNEFSIESMSLFLQLFKVPLSFANVILEFIEFPTRTTHLLSKRKHFSGGGSIVRVESFAEQSDHVVLMLSGGRNVPLLVEGLT